MCKCNISSKIFLFSTRNRSDKVSTLKSKGRVYQNCIFHDSQGRSSCATQAEGIVIVITSNMRPS